MTWVGYAAAEFAPVVACAHKAAILVLRPTAVISGAEIPQAQQSRPLGIQGGGIIRLLHCIVALRAR